MMPPRFSSYPVRRQPALVFMLVMLLLVFSAGLLLGRHVMRDNTGTSSSLDSHVKTMWLEGEVKNAEATLQHAREFMKKTREQPRSQHVDVSQPTPADQTIVIVFCYNRPEYLSRTLTSLDNRLRSDPAVARDFGAIKLVISHDDGAQHPAVTKVAQDWVAQMKIAGFDAEYWMQTRTRRITQQPVAYYALAQHYGKALSRAFDSHPNVGRVIILEDDLELAVDFFSFMAATKSMLDADHTLLAVSAWNDHGRPEYASDPKTIVRADFFPGLGWMMPRRIWNELGSKWPDAYWDDWLREPAQRKQRQVLRPEMTRTITFGSSGSSQGQFFNQYLAPMQLNTVYVDFSKQVNLSMLNPATYKLEFLSRVSRAQLFVNSVTSIAKFSGDVRIEYDSLSQYEIIAAQLGIINDAKAGVPRGAYEGIVPLRMNGRMVYIAPKK